jgi:NTE family protein
MQALVLSGGGTRGSWQAGAVRYLGEVQPSGFHFITGTSVGALIAAGLAMFPPERFSEAAHFVEHIWRDRIDPSMWRLRFPAGLPGLFRPSFGTRDAMEALVSEQLDPERVRTSGISLRLPAVDLCSGVMRTFDENTPDLIQAVLASSALPVLFPPVPTADGALLADGGIRDFTPLKSAIAAGAERIIVLMTEDPGRFSQVSPRQLQSAWRVAERTLRILLHEVLINDIHLCQTLNSLIDRDILQQVPGGPRRIQLQIITPSRFLESGLSFDQAALRAQIEQGYEDARRALGG